MKLFIFCIVFLIEASSNSFIVVETSFLSFATKTSIRVVDSNPVFAILLLTNLIIDSSAEIF